ncbi:MAG: COQ9 family protein [Pseudomonadota bacterium]
MAKQSKSGPTRTGVSKTGPEPGAEARQADRDALLLAILDNVPFDGWTDKVVEQAAKMLDMEPTAAQDLFPDGIAEVLDHLADWADRQALDAMTAADLDEMRVRDRITLAVRAYLEALSPYKDAVRRSFALVPRRAYSGQIPSTIWRSADRFWLKAGDTADDYNVYTKRGLLAGVIASTTLYWLNDNTDNHQASWVFLDRRIDNVLTLGKQFGRFKPLFETAEKAVKAPRKLADRMAARMTPAATAKETDASPQAPSSESLH